MKTIHAYLVLRDGRELRVVRSPPKDQPNELVFEITLKVPTPPRIAGHIDIELPEAPVVDAAHITVAEWIAESS